MSRSCCALPWANLRALPPASRRVRTSTKTCTSGILMCRFGGAARRNKGETEARKRQGCVQERSDLECAMKTKQVLILGAAGRDFHNFNVIFRGNPEFHVVGFTATQIPGIAGRRYPSELAGPSYPAGIPIFEEQDLEKLIAEHEVEAAVFSYSDISHQNLMHLASRVVAAGADFWLLGAERTQIKSHVPVISICAVRTGCGKSPLCRLVASELKREGWKPVVVRHPMPYGDLAAQAVQRFAVMSDLDVNQCTSEEREED